MKRTFNQAVKEQMGKGVEVFVAIKTVEESGEFTEEEIQGWWDRFNELKSKS